MNKQVKKRIIDEVVVTDLVLYCENDGEIYVTATEYLCKNLARKMLRGVYDPELAQKAWLNVITQGAKKYMKEFCTDTQNLRYIFPKPERVAAAQEFSNQFVEKIEEHVEGLLNKKGIRLEKCFDSKMTEEGMKHTFAGYRITRPCDPTYAGVHFEKLEQVGSALVALNEK